MTTKFLTDTGTGTAHYLWPNDEPPAFLVDAIDGARAAHDAWQAANAAGAPLLADYRRTGRLMRDLEQADALLSEIEPAEVAYRAAARSLVANERRAAGALRAFDEIVRSTFVSGDDTRRLAASAALAAQARLVAAHDALLAAKTERDTAWRLAGSPGHPWQARTNADARGGWAVVEPMLKASVDHFDTAATARLAEGEPAGPPSPEGGVSVEQAARGAETMRHSDNYSAQRVR